MFNFLVEFIKHSDEDKSNSDPLPIVNVVIINEDTKNDCQYLASGWDEREYMLLEIGDDIINTDLPDYLQYSNTHNIDQSRRIVY